jgi:hypothetical protein
MISEFRLKIRSDLNPNFRLNEKRLQISDSGDLGNSTRFDLLDWPIKRCECQAVSCVGINI